MPCRPPESGQGTPEKPLLIAHRGYRGLPENTLPAIEKALDLRLDGIEIDLHLTRDGQVLVSHDPAPQPDKCRLASGGSLPLPASFWGELSLSAIQDNYIADRSPELVGHAAADLSFGGGITRSIMRNACDVFAPPSLAQVFELLELYGQLGPEQDDYLRTLSLFLEIKRVPFFDRARLGPWESRFEQCVIRAIEDSRFYGNVTVLSFTVQALQAIRRHTAVPGLALLSTHTPVNLVADIAQIGAQTWCPHYQSLDRSAVVAARRAGLRVIPWTVNIRAEAQILLDWGVSGLITDAPERLAVLDG